MMKQNKVKFIVTTFVNLLPTLIGVILWEKLPDTLAIHFGADNSANGWGSKMFTVFGMPLIITALHILCITVTALDPRKNNIGKRLIGMSYWIIPIISLFLYNVVYSVALGHEINVAMVCHIFLGIMFIVLGNLLPKVKQNSTLGIRIPWTLKDSENWNRTHRVAGWSMAIGGVAAIATAFISNLYVMLIVFIISFVIPVIYSYCFYKRNSSGK